MNNKINNPYLKQLISEIASKTAEGRITGVSWGLIDEAKKKKKIKEADEKKDEKPADDKPADDKGGSLPPLSDKGTEKGGGSLPPVKGADEKPADDKKPESGAGAEKDAPPEASDGSEDAEKAEADAAEAKARLAKAKAEKDQAEKEIEKQSYVKLSSETGTKFLLGKLLDRAFKTNTIDALAGEMVEKLHVKTPEEMNLFAEDMATYMTLAGMPELISSMKTLATKQPETPEKEAPSE